MPTLRIEVKSKDVCDVKSKRASRVQSARSRRQAVHDIFQGISSKQKKELIRRGSIQTPETSEAEVESEDDVRMARAALRSARFRSRRNGLSYIALESPDFLLDSKSSSNASSPTSETLEDLDNDFGEQDETKAQAGSNCGRGTACSVSRRSICTSLAPSREHSVAAWT